MDWGELHRSGWICALRVRYRITPSWFMWMALNWP